MIKATCRTSGKAVLMPILLVLAGSAYAAQSEPDAAPTPQPATGQPSVTSQQSTTDQPSVSGTAATDTDQNWRFATLLAASFTYDDNIFIQPTNKKEDTYTNIDPTVAFGVGNFLDAVTTFADIPHFLVRTGEEDLPWRDFAYASYTPDWVLFSKFHKEDHLNHDARLAAQEERDLWTIKADLHYQNVFEPDIDIGRLTDQTYYTADLSAAYALTGKVTGGAELYGNHSDYSGGLSSTDARGTGFLDYQIAPKTSIGIAAAGGYLEVAQGANQPYEQALLQLKYLPTAKLSFNAQAGGEERQFDSSSVSDRSQFVFDVSGIYDPTDSTELTLRGNRDTLASAEYAGEDIVESVYQASIRQRFLQRLYLTVAGGFAHDNYESNELIQTVARHDDYTFYKTSLSCDVTRHGTVQLYYERRENDSSLAAFGFNENLFGVVASFFLF